MSKSKDEAESFDETLKKLETILNELERGDAPLEKTVEMFESGMGLVRILSRRLEEMEVKINKLIEKDGGELGLEPLESFEDDEE